MDLDGAAWDSSVCPAWGMKGHGGQKEKCFHHATKSSGALTRTLQGTTHPQKSRVHQALATHSWTKGDNKTAGLRLVQEKRSLMALERLAAHQRGPQDRLQL